MELLLRVLVGVVVAAVVVWLLGTVAHLAGLIVGIVALIAFLAVFTAWDGRISRV